MTQKKKKGRRTDWTLKDLDALAAAVAIAKKNLGFSTDDGALRHLIAKGGRWAPPANSSPSQRLKTLKNMLLLANKIQRGADDLLVLAERIQAGNPEK